MEEQSRVAIIGIGCKVPGADNIDQFWKVLQNGENHVVEIPRERWNNAAYYDEDRFVLGKTYSKKAGLLKDVYAFDNKLFNITDTEADQMDPQQRFVLECTHMALEDGGITREQIKGSKTGVYVGAMNGDYRGEFHANSSSITEHTVTGASISIIAARVSYIYDLRAPSMVIDTACSSGLVTIHAAIQAILTGDCDMAFCGGTNLILTPDVFVHLSKAGMLSKGGQCFAFSDQADGYIRGEGCGIIVLKRLSDAKRDDNKIWATIQTGCNHNGRTVSPISAPSVLQQTELLLNLYKNTNVNPNVIDYIEAHGTGTRGDIVEVEAFGHFFESRNALRPRYMGSVKTNIGHLESAAGVIGVIKVLLMMKHSKIVPSLFCETPNSKIDFKRLQLNVPRQLLDWPESDGRKNKVACVNSFGFGGTNGHAIIQSHTLPSPNTESHKHPCIVCFSAKTQDSLVGSIDDLVNYTDLSSLEIQDISYTATQCRDHYNLRFAIVASSTEELLDAIKDKLAKFKLTKDSKRHIVFVFSGMGSSWVGMCRGLLEESPVFRKAIQEIDQHLLQFEGIKWSLERRMMEETNLTDIKYWPIAHFACQVGLGSLWNSLGVVPACVVGHSMGEVAAAYVSGILSLRDAVNVIVHRTLLLAQVAGAGKMVFIRNMATEDVKNVVKRFSGKANVAVEISPVFCAVSGCRHAIASIASVLKAMPTQRADFEILDLDLPLAYHCHLVDSCKKKLKDKLKGLAPRNGKIPMISTVTGELVTHLLDADYWADNVRQPVRFLQAVRKVQKLGTAQIYLEIGPTPFMTQHMKDIFSGEEIDSVASMKKLRENPQTANKPHPNMEWQTFLMAVGSLYEQGFSLDWRAIMPKRTYITPVPRYCFKPRRQLKLSERFYDKQVGVKYGRLKHPFLRKAEKPDGVFKAVLSKDVFPTLYEHRLSKEIIVPGAFYMELGFALTIQESSMTAPQYSISALFKEACPITDSEIFVFDIDIIEESSRNGVKLPRFSVSVNKQYRTYAEIQLHPHTDRMDSSAINISLIEFRCPETLDKNSIYQRLTFLGFDYGPNYSLLKWAKKNSKECLAKLEISNAILDELAGTSLHPAILDAMIQTFVILREAATAEDENGTLPLSVGSLSIFGHVEREMFIQTVLKSSYGGLTILDSTLVSLEGKVIAHLQDLAFKSFRQIESGSEDGTKYICKEEYLPKITDYAINTTWNPCVLHVTDCQVLADVAHENCIVYDLNKNDSAEIVKKLLEMKLKGTEHYKYAVVSTNISVDDKEEATRIQSKIVNMCLVLKHIYTGLSRMPIFVFTKWAIFAQDVAGVTSNINPAMTALWGLTRCVLMEQLATVIMLDLHLPGEKSTLDRMASVAGILHDTKLYTDSPEWLVTEKILYVKSEIPTTRSPIILPTFRYISADESRNVLTLSRFPSVFAEAVLKEKVTGTKSQQMVDIQVTGTKSQQMVDIKVTETALQDYSFFPNVIPVSTLKLAEENYRSLPSWYSILALENVGILQDARAPLKQTKVVTCSPCLSEWTVSVHSDTILPVDMFENYEIGQLTKLVFLWSLQETVTNSALLESKHSLTILVSSCNEGLAMLLPLMLKRAIDTGKLVKLNMVNVQDLDKKVHFNRIILSLVSLDENLIHAISQAWTQADRLITAAGLLGQNAHLLLRVHFPKVNVILKDPMDVFSGNNTARIICEMKEWLSCSQLHRTAVSVCLKSHSGPKPTPVPGLESLMRFTKFTPDRSTVLVHKTELFRKDAVYIVVGGLTGLGWEFVQFLATNGAGNIAIVNRREATEEIKAEIARVCGLQNCKMQVFQADVTQMTSLTEFMICLNKTFSNAPLKGIFFGAAVLDDKSLLAMEREDFLQITAPKILGSWNFHRLTKEVKLDYFVLHSSITSVIGNAFQSSYAVGNAFMDGLAHYRKYQRLSGQSINWGPLDLGLLIGKDVAIQTLKKHGFLVLSREEIAASILPILQLDWAQTICCKFGNIWLPSRSWQIPVEDRIRKDLHRAKDLCVEERAVVYERFVTMLVAQILSVSEENVDPNSSLREMGLDSLLATTLAKSINDEIECQLAPILLVAGEPTVRFVAQKINDKLHKPDTNCQS